MTEREPLRVESRWSEGREEDGLQTLHERLRRRRTARRVVGVAVAAAAVLMGTWGGAELWPRETESRGARGPRPLRLSSPHVFADGSAVAPEGEWSMLEVIADAPNRTELRLVRGGSEFDVTPNPARDFVVVAGEVTVRVLGTAFEVTRDESRRQVYVAVQRGLVSVGWAGDSVRLSAGESGWFPPTPRSGPLAEEGLSPVTSEVEAPEARGGTSSDRLRPRRWIALARREEFSLAYEALVAEGSAVDGASELWLAADAARRSGHPRAAVPYLERLVSEHGGEARAPLAAFTLGRVRLQLGRPAEAANAFARARVLGPNHSVAQDALAREVQAARQAGLTMRVQRLVQEYLRLYPDGPRVEEVRRAAEL